MSAQSLARARRRPEAEQAFEELLSSPATPTEIAYEAGVSFHLAGDPATAVRWFERGLEGTMETLRGRQAGELATGALLALAELGRTAEAAALVERFGRTYPEDPNARLALGEIASVVGAEPGAACRPEKEVGLDGLQQYGNLECRLRRGDEPAALLETVRIEERRATETKPLLLALEAELLSRSGRTADASALARDSWLLLRAGRAASTTLRAFAALVGERAARVAAAAGRPADARAIRDELRRWRDEVDAGSRAFASRHPPDGR